MFRKDFPIFSHNPDLIFLDSASSAQKPQRVIEAISGYLSIHYANIHRGAYDLSLESSHLYDEAKKAIAKKISAASYTEINFTYNATYAFNLLSRWLVKSGILKKWDIVLLSRAEHHANIVPWQILAEEYGIFIEWIELHSDGTIDYDSLSEKLPLAKVLSITGASNVTGEILDLDKVKMIFNTLSTKPFFILDGSQRFPHMATDVVKFGIDFFVGTGHKIMADTGIWFFYGRKDILQKMSPAFCGGGAINSVTTEGYEPAWLPFRHEPGTPHIVGAVSLLTALEYIDSIGGYDVIEKYERELVEYALGRFQESGIYEKGIHLIGSKNPEHRLGVFAFAFENHHPNDIAEILADAGICVRAGHHCTDPLHQSLRIRGSLRMSLYIYNTKEDVDTFIDVLMWCSIPS